MIPIEKLSLDMEAGEAKQSQQPYPEGEPGEGGPLPALLEDRR
jgi:hypothetical protein